MIVSSRAQPICPESRYQVSDDKQQEANSALNNTSCGPRDHKKTNNASNMSAIPSSDKTTGKEEIHAQFGEPLISKHASSIVTQFEEIDALKVKKIDSEKEPKHNSSLLDVHAPNNSNE